MDLPGLLCPACGREYPVTELMWRCTCRSVLDVVPFARRLPARDALAGRSQSLWRYAEVLPVPVDPTVTLHEGMTPLIPAPDMPGARIKLDFLMPTLSFKDRGAAVLATMANIVRPDRLIIDSSGNAGTALAAYAARIGVPCEVFVPAATSPGKLAQMRAHGAIVHSVPGSREDTAAAAVAAACEPGVCYASHVYHPYYLHGTKTYAYEIWEQLGAAPRTVVVPVGNGTLLLGAYLGFREMVDHGVLSTLPVIIGVQAARCAPLAAAVNAGLSEPVDVDTESTIAEGIAIAAPARGAQILAAVAETGGTIVTVTDTEVRDAKVDLATHGLYVEPTAAACWATLTRARRQMSLWPEATVAALNGDGVVIPLCGAGLKSTA